MRTILDSAQIYEKNAVRAERFVCRPIGHVADERDLFNSLIIFGHSGGTRWSATWMAAFKSAAGAELRGWEVGMTNESEKTGGARAG